MATPETKISPDAIIEGLNEGKVKFGRGCIVHPGAKIAVEGDSTIIFGDYNIIEENTIIKAYPKYNVQNNQEEPFKMFVGDYNHFKIGCQIENTNIGNCNIFDYKCKIVGSHVENGAIITPLVDLKKNKIVKTQAVILPMDKTMLNTTFDETTFKKNIQEQNKILLYLLNKNEDIKRKK